MQGEVGPDAAPPVAPVFAALGDEVRLSLLARLSDGTAQSITDLTRDSGLTRQGITKHLGVLEQAGLVTRTRKGRESRFALRPKGLREAKRYLNRAARQWDDAADRLRMFVETEG